MTTTLTQTSKQLALIDPNSEQILSIDTIAKEYGLVHAEGINPFSEGLKMANGIALLRNALNEQLMSAIMTLQGTSLGFKTDKDKEGGYPVNIVRDAVIEALMRGVHLIGNEFNILAGKCYITKEGFGVLLSKIPGLRYFMTPGIPKLVQGGAEATIKVEWIVDGQSHSETLTFAIRVNSGMGADAINGKCERKARAWLYNRITGFELVDGDIENDVLVPDTPNIASSRFSKKKTEKIKVESADEDVIDIVTESPSIEDEYPKLAQALTQRNAPVTVKDISDWHKAYKIPINEDSIIQQLDKCINDCLSWKESINA